MRLLLDTHVMLWWLHDDPRLGPRTKALIATPRARLLVSIASFWELSIKSRIGKSDDIGSLLFEEAQYSGLEVVDVRPVHLAALEGLERMPSHNDPFDHLILAQAIAEKAQLITADRQMKRYDVPCLGRA